MLFISDLEVNIKLLLVTFVDDIMVGKIAKNKSPGQPGETNCTAWLRQKKKKQKKSKKKALRC